MIGLCDYLDDFGEPVRDAEHAAPAPDPAEIEARRLEAFEEGYRAGWDDSVKAQADDSARLTSTFAQHLGDLSFTYQEAYTAIMGAIGPLLDEMIAKLLPEIARQGLGVHITEQLESLAREIGRRDVVIAVAPGRRDAVAPLIEGDFAFPVDIVEDDTLGADQADIRFGETERQIDLGDMLTAFATMVEGFSHENGRKIVNG
ncbi:ABC transporter ATP-binding protein [Citreimonas salinaria]|uniref:Flagellar assembly protein FliH n=1 Tax=Citreimonas salinaria TaxID=321339 RepID=A0A1H3F9A6_9RHOB|nr:ABC transporter ATP-binding protein [Citreimonas salinaria]SDX86784.1 flagellar assembly protein FliH [Citreimonas salinaria]